MSLSVDGGRIISRLLRENESLFSIQVYVLILCPLHFQSFSLVSSRSIPTTKLATEG